VFSLNIVGKARRKEAFHFQVSTALSHCLNLFLFLVPNQIQMLLLYDFRGAWLYLANQLTHKIVKKLIIRSRCLWLTPKLQEDREKLALFGVFELRKLLFNVFRVIQTQFLSEKHFLNDSNYLINVICLNIIHSNRWLPEVQFLLKFRTHVAVSDEKAVEIRWQSVEIR